MTRKPVFNPKTFLTKIGKGKTHTDLSKDHKVFSQGDPAGAVFYIQRGKVKLTVVSKQGKEAVIALLGEGDFFGEGCLAGQPLRKSTVTTITNAPSSGSIRQTRSASSTMSPFFPGCSCRYLLSRSIRMEEDLVGHLFNSSEKRLARVLLLLANFGKAGKPRTLIPEMSVETLAEMIGDTRSKVSSSMVKFESRDSSATTATWKFTARC